MEKWEIEVIIHAEFRHSQARKVAEILLANGVKEEDLVGLDVPTDWRVKVENELRDLNQRM